MKSEELDEIDRILDQALLSYFKREPRPGLEDRVLHYINAAGAGPRFVFPAWALGAAAAALLILLPVWRIRHHSTPASQTAGRADLKTPAAGRLPAGLPSPVVIRGEPESRGGIPAQSLANGAPSGPGSDRSRDLGSPRSGEGAALENVSELPKQAEFPAPSAITGEERALLVLAVSAPDEALKISMSQQEIAPIEVKEIDIRPLRIDGLQQGAGE